jgi:hypothetical protein
MVSDKTLEVMRFKLPSEITSPEQIFLENEGWYFAGNFELNADGSGVYGNQKVKDARKNFSRYKLDTAFGTNGKILPGYVALYVKP